MITKDTCKSWLAEWSRDINIAAQSQNIMGMINPRIRLFENEPVLVAFITQFVSLEIYNKSNPSEVAILVASIVHDLINRQQESDKLGASENK